MPVRSAPGAGGGPARRGAAARSRRPRPASPIAAPRSHESARAPGPPRSPPRAAVEPRRVGGFVARAPAAARAGEPGWAFQNGLRRAARSARCRATSPARSAAPFPLREQRPRSREERRWRRVGRRSLARPGQARWTKPRAPRRSLRSRRSEFELQRSRPATDRTPEPLQGENLPRRESQPRRHRTAASNPSRLFVQSPRLDPASSSASSAEAEEPSARRQPRERGPGEEPGQKRRERQHREIRAGGRLSCDRRARDRPERRREPTGRKRMGGGCRLNVALVGSSGRCYVGREPPRRCSNSRRARRGRRMASRSDGRARRAIRWLWSMHCGCLNRRRRSRAGARGSREDPTTAHHALRLAA